MIEPVNGLYLTRHDFDEWQNYMSPLITSEEKYNGIEIDKEKLGNSIRVKNITFVVTETCNLNCSYCVSGDTQISMSDFSKKSIRNIQIGDQILAFNEFSEGEGKHNKLKVATVEKVYHRKAKTIKLIFEDGTFLNVTENHPILARRNINNPKFDYKSAGKFKPGQSVYSIPEVNGLFDFFTDVNDINYMIGYFVGMMKGDGSYKKYIDKNGYNMFKIRLAVKDDEIIQRMDYFMNILGIEHYLAPFEVSEKYHMIKPAIFANKEEIYIKILNIINDNFGKNLTIGYNKGYIAGLYDAEGHIDKDSNTIRITNTDLEMLTEAEKGLNLMGIPYCIETDPNGTINHEYRYNIRILNANNTKNALLIRFFKLIKPAVERKGISNFIDKSLFFRKKIVDILEGEEIDVYNLATSTRTYIANNILVHNCYEAHKTKKRMSKKVAKDAVDFIFDQEKINGYYDFEINPAVIIEFIGGEPLLEIDIMNYIVEYFKFKAFSLNHPWATNYMISFTSNGILFREKKVQDFLNRNKGRVSIGITIDGNKELHDKCRVFPDGSGSYDIVEKAIKEWVKIDDRPQTKITLCPDNVMYLNEALKNVWSLGIPGAFTNCCFEEGWQTKDAKIMYDGLINLADYLLEDNNYRKYYTSLFDEIIGKDVQEDKNYCGGNGEMLAISPEGKCYPCIRFMQYSLNNQKEQSIGDIYNGLDSKDDNEWLCKLRKVTMTTQCQHEDNKKCLTCPIKSGCSLCTGYNYDKFGDPNHKATFICQTHWARVMANRYFFQKLYKKLNIDKTFDLNIPKEWALEIISEDEYNKLLKL